MLADIETMKPNKILVHRLDRFGVKDAKELGHFLYLLDQHKFSVITAIDGQDHNRDDIYTTITNAIAASQSRQEQVDKADRVLVGKRKTASQGEYIGGKYLTYGFDLVCKDKDGNARWRLVEESYGCRIKYALIESLHEPPGPPVAIDLTPPCSFIEEGHGASSFPQALPKPVIRHSSAIQSSFSTPSATNYNQRAGYDDLSACLSCIDAARQVGELPRKHHDV
jgi:hypothetical protein